MHAERRMAEAITRAEVSVSVIVPVHNGGENFRRCLGSLKESHLRPIEIIVVADGDTDGSSQVAKEFGVQVSRFPSSGGPGRARNLGAAIAQGELLLFIDADVTVPPNVIGQVAGVFARKPCVDAIIGSYDDEPAEPNFLSQYRNLLHHYVHQQGNEDASTFWGACGAIRRSVFLSIGGFDERYLRPSVEDIELGYRLKKAGHTIQLCKCLQVKHLKRWDAISMLKADFFQRALPWSEIILRERKCINDLNTRMSGRTSVALTFLLVSSLILSWWQPVILASAGIVALTLLLANVPLYRFFFRKRGAQFTMQSIPLHWLYFFYSGVAFAVGSVRHAIHRCGPETGLGSEHRRVQRRRWNNSHEP
jgi:GT2 family glycosyltransferase